MVKASLGSQKAPGYLITESLGLDLVALSWCLPSLQPAANLPDCGGSCEIIAWKGAGREAAAGVAATCGGLSRSCPLGLSCLSTASSSRADAPAGNSRNSHVLPLQPFHLDLVHPRSQHPSAMDSTPALSPQIQRKRARVACTPCRQRKRKCDGRAPCTTCQKWDYDCYYQDGRRTKKKAPRPAAAAAHSTPSRLAAPLEARQTHHHSAESSLAAESNSAGSDPDGLVQRLQANSGAAFVRKLALKIDPSRAPKLNLFGWNVGARTLSYELPSAAPTLPIVEISSHEHIETLARVYFDKIDPCYGFLDRHHFFERLKSRWTSQQAGGIYDSVLCGVAALGCLFSQRNATATELHLARSARSCLDSYELMGPPSLNLITGWTLRTIYLRMTSSPHATWTASCTVMHLVEASGLHPESPSAVLLPSAQWDVDLKRRLVGIAYHMNVWTSFDLGLSRVSYQNADLPSLPSSRPGDYTVELLELIPMSLSLEPCRLRNETDLTSTIRKVLSRTHTAPPSILAQCNLVLCIIRRMHSQNLDIPSSLIDDVLALLKKGLEGARSLAADCSPWQHVSNVPFQIICVLLVLDTRSSLAMLPEAMQILSEIASICGTQTLNDAYSTACLLILLYQQRRKNDLAILEKVLGVHQPDRQFASPPRLQTGDENFTWLGELISDLPGLSRVDFDQFLSTDMVNLSFLPAGSV